MPEPTADNAPCPHGMGKPASCIDCMADGPVAAPSKVPVWREIGGPFIAQFDGVCPCAEDITPGQTIRRYDGGTRTVYTHLSCDPR